MRGVFLAAAAGAALTACATAGKAPVSAAPVRLEVPFFAAQPERCGPTALASVLSFWGLRVTPQELEQAVYTPKLKGALPVDLMLAAQARGFSAEAYNGTLDDARRKLDAGAPLIAFLNLGYSFYPKGHFVVLTGYDDARGGVYAHSGQDRDRFVPYARFLRAWDKTDRWTLLVRPGGRYGRR